METTSPSRFNPPLERMLLQREKGHFLTNPRAFPDNGGVSFDSMRRAQTVKEGLCRFGGHLRGEGAT